MRIDNIQKKQSNISLIASLLSIAFNICISFVISPLIVRDLGVEANGFAQLANNFVSYASLITIAINGMAARFTAISYHRGDILKAKKYYSSALTANIIVIFLLIIPALLFILNIEHVVTIQNSNIVDVKILFALTFLNFFISNIQSVFNISTMIKNMYYLSSSITMIANLVRILLLILFFKIFGVKLFFISLAAFISTCLSLAEYYLVKIKLIPEVEFSFRLFEKKSLIELLGSGVWSVINKCGDLLMTGFDLLLTNLLIGSIQMGVLSVAKTIPTQLMSIASTVSWNWNPRMIKEYSEGNSKAMLDIIDETAKVSSIIVSIPTVAFSILSIEFYKLWMPSQDANHLAILSILSVMSYYLLSGTAAVYNIFTVTNKLSFNSITYVMGAAISIVLSILAAKFTDFGIYAVAGISSVIVILRNLLFLLPYAAKCMGLKWYAFYKYVKFNLACDCIVAFISIIVKNTIKPNTWISFVFGCAIIATVSISILYLLLVPKSVKEEIKIKLSRKAN